MTCSLTIAALTFRRNDYLDELLPALVDQARAAAAAGTPARVLIVDNDPAAGARRVVAAAAERAAGGEGPDAVRAAGDEGPAAVDVVYVHEPTPGIVAGRNRALDESAGSDLLAFIDDDELPSPEWITSLLATRADTGAQAVTGPTPPVFEREPDPWVRASGAFESWDAPDGSQVRSADTGNLLLDLGFVREAGLRFDPRYGLTGGEDSLFTRQLTLRGGVIRFSAGAVVTKRVPDARARRSWVLTRSLRSGTSWARVRLDTLGGAEGARGRGSRVPGSNSRGSRVRMRATYAVKGAGKAVVHGLASVVDRARGNVEARAAHEVSCAGGAGMVLGAFGRSIEEYGRPKAGKTSAVGSGASAQGGRGEGTGVQAGYGVAPAGAPSAGAQGTVAPAPRDPGGLTLTIAIPTYKRPDDLRRALEGVLPQAAELVGAGSAGEDVPRLAAAEVLVVDNDPAGSARQVVEEVATSGIPGDPAGGASAAGATVPVRYALAERPGVAAVRNRALEECADRDLLVFIDDDEEPLPGWLAALLGTMRDHRAHGVAGHVLPAYDVEPEPWVRAGGFFERQTWATGTPRPVAATNCLLLDLGFVRAAGLRFDEAFGATGGEDALFTRQLVAAGGRLVWCAQARVLDHVPAERLSRTWVLRRRRSHAATGVRVEMALAGPGAHLVLRGRALAGGALRAVAGAARAGVGLVTGDVAHQARGARLRERGIGMVSGALGRRAHQEYGRTPG